MVLENAVGGAGGTEGGVGQVLIGFVMFCGGMYLLLSAISVHSSFGWGTRLFGGFGGGYGVTGGISLIPFLFGVGLVFYNRKSLLGRALAFGSVIALIFGVLASGSFSLRGMSAFELLAVLILLAGGGGLLLNALRGRPKQT